MVIVLIVNKRLSSAKFDEPSISLCYSSSKVQLGYVLKFGDFNLYVNEYVAQIVNVLGTSSVNGVIASKRKVVGKGYTVANESVGKLLSAIEGNTLLLGSLSLYLNDSISEFIKIDFNEWGTLNKKHKLFITYLLGLTSKTHYLMRIYKLCTIEEKSELFVLMLSLVGMFKEKLSLIEKTVDLEENSGDMEKLADSTSSETMKLGLEIVNKIEQDYREKTDTVTVVERTFGKFHIGANTKFYENLVEVYKFAPLYRGRTSWTAILRILRDNPKYSAVTEAYINSSGYKLNVNNLRNWYNYYVNNTLKTEKFKIISNKKHISEIFTEIDYTNVNSIDTYEEDEV